MKHRIATLLLVSAGLLGVAHAQDGVQPSATTPAVPAVKPAAAAATPAPPTASQPAPTTVAVATPAPTATPTPDAGNGMLDAPATADSDVTATGNAAPNAASAPSVGTIDASSQASADDSDGIAATVNDESISDYELRQRMALFISTSGLQPTPEDLKRIRGQILDKLEDEKIQLQEAVKKHITVSPVEVDKAINSLLGQNHLTMDQLRKILENAGTSDLALRSQITAQLAWQKTVQDEYADLVNVSQAQIDAEVQRDADGANKPHFLVAEIFLPVTTPEQDNKVLQDAQNIENQLQSGAQFGAVAHQFSQNPAAAQGGAIGWVHDGQLQPELNNALAKMATNSISPPIRSAGGYYILQLQARQEPLGTKINDVPTAGANPDGSLQLVRLLLPLGASPSKEEVNSAMNFGNQLRAGYQGCEQLKAVGEKMKSNGAVFMDLGTMKPSELSAEVQKALADTHPGEATAPLISDAGLEIIGRCDKRIEVQTAYVLRTREQIEEELFDQQISALAQRYMRDLKRDADVEVR